MVMYKNVLASLVLNSTSTDDKNTYTSVFSNNDVFPKNFPRQQGYFWSFKK